MGRASGYNADAAASGNGCFNSSKLWTTTETRQFDHYNDGGDHLDGEALGIDFSVGGWEGVGCSGLGFDADL